MPNKIRTLIVDDEPLARDRLRHLLQSAPQVDLVGECADGQQALAAIDEKKPDLVFLDIQMPEMDGFDVLEAIQSEPRPFIVFVTAYDKFAVRAFEVHAVDYLLKPFDRERFQQALARALEQVQHRSAGQPERQAALLAEVKPAPRNPDRLPVKSGGRVLLVKVSEIDWIKAAHNYVELHEHAQTHLLRETLGTLEQRLPVEKFVRISRSVIVNVERVKELQPLFWGEYAVVLQDGTKLTLSRRYRHKLPQLGLS